MRKINKDHITGISSFFLNSILSSYITKEGKVILKRLNDKIKIYKDKHKKQLLLPNPKSEDPDTLTWDLSDATQRKNFLSIKDNLWIEGYGVSSNSGDTGLQLTYRPIKPLSGGVLQDIIDTMKMTVVKIDLKIWPGGSDLDIGQEFNNGRKYPGDVDKLAISESKEEREGAYLLVNWDDDDGDVNKGKPTPDLYEDYVKEEDNLSKMLPIINPILDKGIVELEIISGKDKIKLWRKREKGQEIKMKDNKKTWNLSDSAQRDDIKKIIQKGIFIEGISASNKERDITIKIKALLKIANF